MNFKADWSFLEKISMGAISSREVVKMLNDAGHSVIELERYSTSNKIWATKIKRLRLPDLICLKCGRRIESRAKSNLDVRMSDNENNPDRRWDAGLRDKDLIVFIRCRKEENGWIPATEANYFETLSLRNTVDKSKLGEPKSAGEGAERDRIWPTTIPKKNGKVLEITKGDDKLQIKVEYVDGKKYTYSIKNEKGYHVYCKEGDTFIANETMIAGAPTQKISMNTCMDSYDFLEDLKSDVKEVRYAGVKALGYLDRKKLYVDKLIELKDKEQDYRIGLEIYSSLLRLGEDVWDEFNDYAMAIEEEIYRFEYVLILSELSTLSKASKKLCSIAKDATLDSELRSAAAWGIEVKIDSLSDLIEIAKEPDDNVASHAIAHIIENFNSEYIKYLISIISDDVTGGIVLKILTESENVDQEAIVTVYKNLDCKLKEKWCAMIIGLLGAEKFAGYEAEVESIDTEQFQLIKSLWDYSKSSVNAYKSGEIDFLRKQSI